jgi:glycosyltransferase involved in cell wall biosynthesis
MLPTVCIIIPTYNQAAYIRRAVASALAQSYPNLQVVVADDGSTDDTHSVLQAEIRGRRIQYHRSASNLGRVQNYRHALCNYTAADWVINLDGDDFLTDDEFIADAIKSIQERGENRVLFFQGTHEVRGDLREGLQAQAETGSDLEVVLTARQYFFGFFDRVSFSHVTTLYRREAALKSGFYEFDVLSSDMYSVLKLCLNNADMEVVLSEKKSAVWYQHAGNSSKSVSLRAHLQNFALLSGLTGLARQRDHGWLRSHVWQVRLTAFYGLVYAGALWRKGTAAPRRWLRSKA